MATMVASRFAVLCDDAEDVFLHRNKRNAAKKHQHMKESVPVAATSLKTTKKKKKKSKETIQVESVEVKVKSDLESEPVSQSTFSPDQWEEWQEKDKELMDGSFRDDLSQALLLSKLDYEEKKDFYEYKKTAGPSEKKCYRKGRKPVKVLSVEEFYNLGKKKVVEDPSRIWDDSSVQLKKSKAKQHVSEHNPVTYRLLADDDELALARVRDDLDQKKREVHELREENSLLKGELDDVRDRYKKLRHLLTQGEMKEKALVLLEVDRLETVRNELSEQVASLHAQLEQERSKVRALSTDPKFKDKNKKRTTSIGDQ